MTYQLPPKFQRLLWPAAIVTTLVMVPQSCNPRASSPQYMEITEFSGATATACTTHQVANGCDKAFVKWTITKSGDRYDATCGCDFNAGVRPLAAPFKPKTKSKAITPSPAKAEVRVAQGD